MIGTSDFARFRTPPESSSAPLAFCADIILSVSSTSVGINLSAIVIIIESSCTGNLNFLSGDKSRSIASVSIIGDVRGKGLMIGCEFVNPKGAKDCCGLFPPNGEAAAKIQNICFKNKLVMEKGGRNGSVMRCLCALTVTDEEIDTAMNIFESAVLEVNKDYE